ARRVMDRSSAQDPVARRHAQQPRLSPGGDARAAAVQLPQSRRQSRQRFGTGRHQHHESRYSVSPTRAVNGLVGERPDRRPGRSGAGNQGGGRRCQVRPAGTGQCFDSAALRRASMRLFPVTAAVIALAFAAGAAWPVTALAASAEKGKTAYVRHGCWQCHGYAGQGSLPTSGGKVIARTPLPLDAFRSFVRTTDSAMPPYRPAGLTHEELDSLYAYLQSLPKPKAVS